MGIHKVHSRGGGGGAGPIDYLLGKDRAREGATLLRGDPEQIIELIDSLKFAQKYTSGVISFAEKNIPEQHKTEIMDALEKTLLPGLDSDRYSVVWIEHMDKGRLELNYVFANVELESGKRLAPYYDKADRKRVQAWMETVRHDYKLADPNEPERKQALTTPSNLPRDKKLAVETITAGLLELANRGAIKNRADVVQTLSSAGFEVVREVKGSISIADPAGGKNLRLQGMIYERDFKFSGSLSTEIRKAGREYRAGSAERVQKARADYQSMLERKSDYIRGRYPREPQAPEKPDFERLAVVLSDNYAAARSNNRRVVFQRGMDSGQHQNPERAGQGRADIDRTSGAEGLERRGQADDFSPQGLGGRRELDIKNGAYGADNRHEKSTGEKVNERANSGRSDTKKEAESPLETKIRRASPAENDAGAPRLFTVQRATERGRSGGYGAAASVHHLRALQNNQERGAGMERRGKGAAGGDEHAVLVRRAVQQPARYLRDDVRDVPAATHGAISDEQHRDPISIIDRIRDVAERARGAGRGIAERAKTTLQLLRKSVERLDETIGRLDRAVAIQQRADHEHNAAGERLSVSAGDFEQTAKTVIAVIEKQREQQRPEPVQRRDRDHGMSM